MEKEKILLKFLSKCRPRENFEAKSFFITFTKNKKARLFRRSFAQIKSAAWALRCPLSPATPASLFRKCDRYLILHLSSFLAPKERRLCISKIILLTPKTRPNAPTRGDPAPTHRHTETQRPVRVAGPRSRARERPAQASPLKFGYGALLLYLFQFIIFLLTLFRLCQKGKNECSYIEHANHGIKRDCQCFTARS